MVFIFNIQGLSTVSRAVINEVSSENRFELIIEGDGLKEVLGAQGVGLHFFNADGLNTTTNNTLECLKTLGIEAARFELV
jgi:DNA-directed RNA polymerase III subunit RPC1